MYSSNNTAKEYVIQNVARVLDKNKSASILDFACGTCLIWKSFLEKYPTADFNGFDFNIESIEMARRNFPKLKEKILVLDGQEKLPFNDQFDIITTFSSLEHVVDKNAFLENIKKMLKPGGIAYLNYDIGHFKQGILTNIYNHISQLLVKLKITEKYYTKRVRVSEIKEILAKLNLEITDIKFFNLLELKKLHKNIGDPEIIKGWYEYELLLNKHGNKNFLESNFSSIVIEIRK